MQGMYASACWTASSVLLLSFFHYANHHWFLLVINSSKLIHHFGSEPFILTICCCGLEMSWSYWWGNHQSVEIIPHECWLLPLEQSWLLGQLELKMARPGAFFIPGKVHPDFQPGNFAYAHKLAKHTSCYNRQDRFSGGYLDNSLQISLHLSVFLSSQQTT